MLLANTRKVEPLFREVQGLILEGLDPANNPEVEPLI